MKTIHFLEIIFKKSENLKIKVCSNEGPCPISRGVNYEIENTLMNLKKFCSIEKLGQFQPNLAQIILK